MSRGFVYVLSNPSMPGLVKIGKTTRSPESRAFELFQTGVPTPFEVEWSVFSPDCHGMEAEAHTRLCDLRVSNSREFFRCEAGVARSVLADLLIEQVESIVEEFIPELSLVNPDYSLDPFDVKDAASANGIQAVEVKQVLKEITAAEMETLLARYRDRCDRRRLDIASRDPCTVHQFNPVSKVAAD